MKVIVAVVCVVAATEAGIRAAGARISMDDLHCAMIPAIAAKLSERPPPRILFLGNSLTRRGVRLDSFQDQLADTGLPPVSCEKVFPDDTVVGNWYYLYKCEFAEMSREPELAVFGFVGDQLSDQADFRAGKVAKTVSKLHHLEEIFEHDLVRFDDRAGFLLAFALDSVCKHERVKSRALTVLIPHYKTQTRAINFILQSSASGQAHGGAERPRCTYERLRRLLQILRQGGTRGVFILMPHPGYQSLDPELLRVLADGEALFVDLHGLSARVEGHFPDGYHMDAMAADLYSRAAADAVSGELRRITSRRRETGI